MSKNVLFITGGNDGCGYYRIYQIFNMLAMTDQNYITPMFIGTANLTPIKTDVIFTQRVVSEKGFKQVMEYKEKNPGTKFIIDYDDIVWSKDKLHKYNVFLNKYDVQKNYESMKKYLPEVADHVTVSCEYLKNNISEFFDKDKITVLPNLLSIKDWCFDKTVMLPKDDIFFYAGSTSHYNNEKKQYGDFDIPLANFLNKQKVLFMGGESPWFITPYEKFDWCNLHMYSKALWQNTRYCKFTLAPLVENEFNKCKSDLKLMESAAIGRVCLVSDFPDSPYSNAHPLQKIPANSSIKDIQNIVENAKLHYKEILDHQYSLLNNRWLDYNMTDYITLFYNV